MDADADADADVDADVEMLKKQMRRCRDVEEVVGDVPLTATADYRLLTTACTIA